MTQIIVYIDSPPMGEPCTLPQEIQQQMAYMEYSRTVFGIRQELRNHQGMDIRKDDTGD